MLDYEFTAWYNYIKRKTQIKSKCQCFSREEIVVSMEGKENYVNPQINVIDFGMKSDIITTSSNVGVLPPDWGDIDQDSWV